VRFWIREAVPHRPPRKTNPEGWQSARMPHRFSCIPPSGYFRPTGGFRMTDRRFYLLLTLPVLALAAGEVFYAVVGITSSVRVRFGFGFLGSGFGTVRLFIRAVTYEPPEPPS